ncbi:hypothetical protein KY336_03445 [Candidatus Woesearchaeota archaeon]|nr:hypothetical protein [Candidatus Woesearchaeota archaeon]
MVRVGGTVDFEDSLIRRDIAAFRAFVEKAFGGTFKYLIKNWRRLIRMESKLDRALTILEDLRDLINRVDLENLEDRIVTRISAKIADAIRDINLHTDQKVAEIMTMLADMDTKLDELLGLLRALNLPDFAAEFAELRRIMADIAANMADKHDVRTILDAITRLDAPLNTIIADLGTIKGNQAVMGRDIQTIIADLRTHAADMQDFRREAMTEFTEIKTRLNDVWDLLLNQYGPQLTTMNNTVNQILGIVQGLQQGGAGGQAPPISINFSEMFKEVFKEINLVAENNNLLMQEQQMKALFEVGAAAFAEAQAENITKIINAIEAASRSSSKSEAAILANIEAMAAQNQSIEAQLTAVAEALAVLIGQEGGGEGEQQQIINNYNTLINMIANIIIIINGRDPDDPDVPGSLTAALIHSWKQGRRGGKKAIENKKIIVFEDEELDLFGILFGKADPNLEYRWYATDSADPAGNELQTFNAGTINGTNAIMHETDITIQPAFLMANNHFWVNLYVKDSHNNEHVYTIEVETKQREQLGEPEFEIKPDWHTDRENSVIIGKETGFFFFIINTKPNSVGTIGWRVRVQDEANNNVARELRLSINNPFIAGPGQMSDDQRYYQKTIKYTKNKKHLFRVSGSITIPLSLARNIVNAPEEEREALIEAMLRRRFKLLIDIGKWDPNTTRRNGRILVPSPPNYVDSCTLIIRPSREDVQRVIRVLNQKLQILSRKINSALTAELSDLKTIKDEIFDADAIKKLMIANQAGGVFREKAAIDAFKDVALDDEFKQAMFDFKSKLEVSEDIEHLIENVFVNEAAAEEEIIGRVKELIGVDRDLEDYEEKRIKEVAKDFMKIVKKRNRELKKAIGKIEELNSVFEKIIHLINAIEADNPDDITEAWMTVLGELNIRTAEVNFKKAYQKILRMRTFIKKKIEKSIEISEQELYEVEKLQDLTHEFT